ncbi:MAG: hypothetical protein KY434_03855 [Actinobacteria bacterium]|nr:hypothetical protein [Actinomycetota bacterium]
MTASRQYALWLALVRGELTEAEAAERYGVDLAAVSRIRQVAEQGALSALSTSDPQATAQVAAPPGLAAAVGVRVVDLLAGSPVFLGVPRDRLEALARAATLAFLGEHTPVAEGLAAAPLVVAQGTLLVIGADDRPIDLVGRGAFRASKAGRRLVPLTAARVAALPRAAVEDTGAVTRARLATGVPFAGAQGAPAAGRAPVIATTVLGDLLDGTPPRVDPDTPIESPTGGSSAGGRPPPLDVGTPLLDALVRMLETGAGALTVSRDDAPGGGRVVGALAAGDLPLPEQAGLSGLLDALGHADTVEALAAVVPSARTLVRELLAAGADVGDAGRVLAAVGDQLMRRLLAVAHVELGPPPGDYAWLVFGSHARREQTPGSDQDTGLVYATGLDAEGHAWYVRLGEWMTAALETCGYRHCPGGVMASRPDWRHDLDGWARTVRGWASRAETSRLVGADIGFDVRTVAGVGDLGTGEVAGRLARKVVDATRSELTAARLARAAVARRPPSALWGRVGRNPLGPQLRSRHRRFNLKRQAVQPIVDLARLHTLLRGGTEVGTAERLAATAADGELSPDLAATLVEGLRLLTWTRLSAQLGGADPGPSGDRVDWGALPGPLRAQFSDTFGAIRSAQDALRARYRLTGGP